MIMNMRLNDYKIKATYRDLSQLDGLTGLLNKFTCETAIQNYLRSRSISEDCILIILDIDNFKSINDNYGHQTGDDVLKSVSAILSASFRPSDLIGRFGGDEFLILMQDCNSDTLIEQKCNTIQAAVKALRPNGRDISLTCSIGVVKTIGSYISYSDLFRMADDALYEAKNFGKDQFVLHLPLPSLSSRNRNYMLIIDDMAIDRAILRETFSRDFEILEASGGREALCLLNQHATQIAIVILDIYMDDLDGYDVLQYMKSRTYTQRIPILVITSDANHERRALECGADDMIQKPIQPGVLMLRVNNILRRPL